MTIHSPVDAQTLANWVSCFVQIPSVSPAQAGPRAGISGEAQIADAIADWFRGLGANVFIDEVLPGRPNVYGMWQGKTDRWLAVDVHTDTVGVEQMTIDPFGGHIADGRVYGRGAVDTKATLGILLALLESFYKHGQMPDVGLLIGATMDEEVGATGAPAFARWIEQQNIPVAQLIVAEPTGCIPVHGHKGVVRMAFDVAGKAAHSAQPQQGQNAIMAAAFMTMAFLEEQERMQHEVTPTALGLPQLTVTLVNGGTGINIVPEACRVSIDRRVVDGEEMAEIVGDLTELAQAACPLPVHVTTLLEVDAFLQPAESEFVQQLAAWSGNRPMIAPYGTNATAYNGLPCECVVIGPGSIDQAHSANEWVAIDELVKMAEIYGKWLKS